ncbi:hypothetical protein KAR48_07215 [bacterium]|nr:hypothetical protein [bacterium]
MKFPKTHLIAITITVLSIVLLSGCGSTAKLYKGTPETGLTLMYNLDKGQEWKYDINMNNATTMEMMGQAMEMSVESIASITINCDNVLKDEGIKGSLRIDKIKINATSPQGKNEADVSGFVGQKFPFNLSPSGEEVIEGIDSVKVDMGQMGGGSQTAFKNIFKIFQDLPATPIKIGDSWSKSDTTITPQMGSEMNIIINTTYTFEAVELIDNMSCIKIVSIGEGTIDGGGEQQGAQFTIEGDMENSSTFYFAYKVGKLVKTESLSLMEGSAAVSGAANMTIPMSVETTNIITLIK